MIIYLLRLNFNGIAKYLRVVSFSFLLFVLFYGVGGQSIQAQDPFVVVLDAGHGGKDPGNSGFRNKYQEKKIVLNITLEIGKKLESQSGIKVIYTRKRDVFVDLIERDQMISNPLIHPFIMSAKNENVSF